MITAREAQPELAPLAGLARLHTRGVPVTWRRVFSAGSAGPAGPADLPTYPFQRGRYWLRTPLTGLPGGTVEVD